MPEVPLADFQWYVIVIILGVRVQPVLLYSCDRQRRLPEVGSAPCGNSAQAYLSSHIGAVQRYLPSCT